jgi:hypothetical protein
MDTRKIILMVSMNTPNTVPMQMIMEMVILHVGAQELVRYDTGNSVVCKGPDDPVGVETPFPWQQQAPAAYSIPHNTVGGPQHYMVRSDQRWPQDFRTASGSLQSRNVSMQPFYTMADQHDQGNAIPKHGVRTSCDQPSFQGIRLRPVSDLRTPSSCR